MNLTLELKYYYQILGRLFKLIFHDFQDNRNILINRLITCSLVGIVINYIYTIGFYEKDPFYIIAAFAYLSSQIQVSSIDQLDIK